MPIDIDLSLIRAAAVGAITGASITGSVLFVMHRRRVKAESIRENIGRPVCLYSATDPLNAGIIRASRGGQ